MTHHLNSHINNQKLPKNYTKIDWSATLNWFILIYNKQIDHLNTFYASFCSLHTLYLLYCNQNLLQLDDMWQPTNGSRKHRLIYVCKL